MIKGVDSIWMRYPLPSLNPKFLLTLYGIVRPLFGFLLGFVIKGTKLTPRRKGKVLAPKQIIIEKKVKPKGK